MSAPVANMVGEESSSDEDLEKFKEAAWSFDTGGNTNGIHNTKTADGESNGVQSRRMTVSKHEHDGNELQTTPEFRAHVAKKLGVLLDSYISERSAETSSSCTETTIVEDDEGFLLFTTSVPGQCAPPSPVRRRPIPSSSDSDAEMEMRFREAAVSVTDLLPPSALPSGQPSSPTEIPCSEKTKKKNKKKKKKKKGQEGEEVEEDRPVPKKKRKLSQGSEDVESKLDCEGSSLSAKTEDEPKSPAEESLALKVNRKRRRRNKKALMEGKEGE